jgi:endonuclease-3
MAEKTIKHTTSEIKRRTQILSVLHKLYPDPRSELEFKNPYELVVAVALSAQCTDKKVNEVTKNLFKQFPTFQQLAKANVRSIENTIRQVNYFKTKSKNIKLLAEKVCCDFNGSLPVTHQELTSLPGVGNKTANVVLSELKIAPAFPVDTHVFRVSRRLKLARGKDVTQVEASLKKNFKPEQWHDLHHWLIFHGRRVCKAQNPHCESCTLNTVCPSSELNPK